LPYRLLLCPPRRSSDLGVEQDPEQAQRQTFDLLTGGLPNRPLPISPTPVQPEPTQQLTAPGVPQEPAQPQLLQRLGSMGLSFIRSEEHTSELQSREKLV